MNTRILFGSIAIAVVVALVAFDVMLSRNAPLASGLFARGSTIPLVLASLSGLGCIELAAMLRRLGYAPYTGWAVLSCMAIVLAPWLAPCGLLGEGLFDASRAVLVFATLAALGTGLWGVILRDVPHGLNNIAGTGLLIGYLGVLPAFLTMIRCDLPGEQGAWVLLTLILICKVTDIGAYFVGTLLGRTKLIPAVSPAKSVEGLFGGIVASCAVSLLFWWLHRSASAGDVAAIAGTATETSQSLTAVMTVLFDRLSWTQTIVLGGVMAIVGQLGDLVESIFKRSAGAKDSGAVMPGFGGILDIIDSPIAVAPVAWMLLTIVWEVL